MREIHIKLGARNAGAGEKEREREREDAKEGQSATTRARTNIICLTAASRSHGLMVTGIAVVVIRQQLVVVPSLIAR